MTPPFTLLFKLHSPLRKLLPTLIDMDVVDEAPFSFKDFFSHLGDTQGLDLGTDPRPFPHNSIPPA